MSWTKDEPCLPFPQCKRQPVGLTFENFFGKLCQTFPSERMYANEKPKIGYSVIEMQKEIQRSHKENDTVLTKDRRRGSRIKKLE